MATRETPFVAGTPCWVDLLTSDLDRSRAFYTGVFGWEIPEPDPEYGGYINALSDGHGVAGIMGGNTADSGVPDSWTTYLSTDDLTSTLATATEAGAAVISEATQVGALGSMAVLLDPAGASVGVWQPALHTGFRKYNEAGSVTWDELHTKDFPASIAFYQKVFDWQIEKMADSDEFRYYNGQVNGAAVAGVMDAGGYLPPEAPSAWVVYFSVPDTDQAIVKVLELGGSVNIPAEDSPFGRVADVSDSTGASFKLHSNKLATPAP